jgi:hypothetical protein
MPPKIKLKLPGFPGLDIDEHGTFANVSFKSTNPVVPIVVCGFNKPTKKTPTGLDFAATADIRSTAFPLLAGLQTSHMVRLDNLVPDQEFWLVIKGKDHLNRIKPFKTLRRRLDVNFFQIRVIDDSDDLSPGDFKFGFYVNEDNAPNGKSLLHPKSGTKSISTGAIRAIDVNATVFGGDVVKVKATGVDNDDDPDLIVMLDTHGSGLWPPTSPDLGSGSDSTYEWVSDQDIVIVDFPGPEENRTVSFELDARFPKKTDLHFKAKGKVKISHVK